MVFRSADANKVELLAEELLMRQHLDMNLFTITEYHLVNMGFPEKGAKMEVKFKRKITSEMMTTFLPSVLLMMTTYATTFFKPFFFEAALSVNLTTMLVMTTIFISKMESLPPTSDIKMIDIWLILCQIYPFAEVVLLTAMEYQRDEKKKERKYGKSKSKVQIENSISISIMDDINIPKTRWEALADVVSRLKASGLKTVGKTLKRS